MVLKGVPRKKSPVTPPRIDPGTFRLVAQRLNHYASPGPWTLSKKNKVEVHNIHTSQIIIIIIVV